MATTAHSPACGLRPGLARPPAMRRCECADISFEDVAARVAEGDSLAEVGRRTGCGQTCTACLPDLQRYLASRAR